jgi:hypothetical protein
MSYTNENLQKGKTEFKSEILSFLELASHLSFCKKKIMV